MKARWILLAASALACGGEVVEPTGPTVTRGVKFRLTTILDTLDYSLFVCGHMPLESSTVTIIHDDGTFTGGVEDGKITCYGTLDHDTWDVWPMSGWTITNGTIDQQGNVTFELNGMAPSSECGEYGMRGTLAGSREAWGAMGILRATSLTHITSRCEHMVLHVDRWSLLPRWWDQSP